MAGDISSMPNQHQHQITDSKTRLKVITKTKNGVLRNHNNSCTTPLAWMTQHPHPPHPHPHITKKEPFLNKPKQAPTPQFHTTTPIQFSIHTLSQFHPLHSFRFDLYRARNNGTQAQIHKQDNATHIPYPHTFQQPRLILSYKQPFPPQKKTKKNTNNNHHHFLYSIQHMTTPVCIIDNITNPRIYIYLQLELLC